MRHFALPAHRLLLALPAHRLLMCRSALRKSVVMDYVSKADRGEYSVQRLPLRATMIILQWPHSHYT